MKAALRLRTRQVSDVAVFWVTQPHPRGYAFWGPYMEFTLRVLHRYTHRGCTVGESCVGLPIRGSHTQVPSGEHGVGGSLTGDALSQDV